MHTLCYIFSKAVCVSWKCALSGGLMNEFIFILQASGTGKNLKQNSINYVSAIRDQKQIHLFLL
jgi:hypothetical protein